MVELSGEYDFPAPQELVWQMLLDPEVLAKTIPGCEKLEEIDVNSFQGRMNIRVGPVQGAFQGKVEASDLHPPTSFRINLNGNGPAGVVRAEGVMMLETIEAITRLRYDGTAQISGRIASVGQRVMDSSAKSIVKQSLQNLDKQIQARLEPEATTAGKPVDAAVAPSAVRSSAPTAPPAPSQFEFMRNVTADVLQDLIPDPQQRKLLVGLGLAAVVIGLINGFANLVARRVAKILKEN